MPVKHVTVKQAHDSQSKGSVYVDVRSIPEYAQGHPSGAVNVPLIHQDERTGQMVPNAEFVGVMQGNFPPDASLLIGCQVGGLSAQAAQVLEAAGFGDVTNVLGGYGGARDPITGAIRTEGWIQAQLPIELEQTPGTSYRALAQKSGGGR